MEHIVSKNIFVSVPVETLPDECGWYPCLSADNQQEPFYAFYFGKTTKWSNPSVTHWLKREVKYVFSEDELRNFKLDVVNEWNNREVY